MIKKILRLFLTMAITGLLITTGPLETSAGDYSGTKQLTPQLSVDGRTLYNGVPSVVYVVDPNPPANQTNISPSFNLTTLGENATATFSITYIANGGTDPWGHACYTFPDEAKAAFNAAAAIWGNLLTSSVPITINACWSELDPNILGSSGGGPLRRDFAGAPRTNTWYGAALANSLAGADLDPGVFDMNITYSRTFSWYFGTDGATPVGQYDLMSVVLHEIAHGLNFMGSMRYSSGSGSWGYSTGYPNIYDTFMRDGTANPGNLLLNTVVYANPSAALGSALTSNSIWFHGVNAMAANGGTRVKMYAPGTWSAGSSYAHLDYATFSAGVNRLMVYAFSSGVSTHAPGPVTLGLLKDLDWTVGTSNPVPVMSSLNTTSATAGGAAFTLTVSGSNFVTSSVVRFNGVDRTTTFVASNQLTATIPTSAIAAAGIFPVAVFNPTPGGGTSNAVDFTVNNPVPSITGLSPSTVAPNGGAFTLTVNGSNFVNGSVVSWNGSARTTTYVSGSQVTAAILSTDVAAAGTANITIYNSTPGGGTSNTVTFSIAVPVPASGGGGGGCFIATAAFGTPMEKHVSILREFRDRILLTTSAGKAFVKFYYEVSPPIAGKIAQSDGLRFVTRCSLLPFVGMAYLMVSYGTVTVLLGMLSFLLLAGTLIVMIRRKMTAANS